MKKKGRGQKTVVAVLLAGVLAWSHLAHGQEAFGEFLENPQAVYTSMEAVPDSSFKKVVARALIDASVDRVWSVVVHYENFGSQNRYLKVTKVERLEGGERIVHLLFNFPWPLNDLPFVIHFHENEEALTVSWDQKSGLLKKNSGSLQLEEFGDKTLLTFAVTLDLGKYVPQWAVTWGGKEKCTCRNCWNPNACTKVPISNGPTKGGSLRTSLLLNRKKN